MARFRLRDTTEAVQWNKVGDHPKVSHWDVGLTNTCLDCKQSMDTHGKILVKEKFQKVCPGDWIVESPVQGSIPVRPHVFESMYIPVEVD